MSYHYIDKTREEDPCALADVEVFYGKPEFVTDTPGWCYAYGSPGCIPDSDPVGPYDTEAEALKAAREAAGYCEHGVSDEGICEECPAPELWGLYSEGYEAWFMAGPLLESTVREAFDERPPESDDRPSVGLDPTGNRASMWTSREAAEAYRDGRWPEFHPRKLPDADARRWGRSDSD